MTGKKNFGQRTVYLDRVSAALVIGNAHRRAKAHLGYPLPQADSDWNELFDAFRPAQMEPHGPVP
jgi:hypothetical protein